MEIKYNHQNCQSKRREGKRKSGIKGSCKMADLSSNILMTDLNKNSLNSLRQMQRFSQWINAITQLYGFPRNPLWI